MSDQKEEPQVQLTTQQLLQMISDSRIDMARSNARLDKFEEKFLEQNEKFLDQNARFLEQGMRFDLLLGRVASNEEETKEKLAKINRRVDRIEEGIAASEEVKVVFEE